MTLWLQVAFGSGVLVVCALIHAISIMASITAFRVAGQRLRKIREPLRKLIMLCLGLLTILAAHTATIWIWTAMFILAGAFAHIETSFYFATVTYTTLGYGDLVPDPGIRIFATFAAVTGLLTFGISTAFLIGLLVRLLPETLKD